MHISLISSSNHGTSVGDLPLHYRPPLRGTIQLTLSLHPAHLLVVLYDPEGAARRLVAETGERTLSEQQDRNISQKWKSASKEVQVVRGVLTIANIACLAPNRLFWKEKGIAGPAPLPAKSTCLSGKPRRNADAGECPTLRLSRPRTSHAMVLVCQGPRAGVQGRSVSGNFSRKPRAPPLGFAVSTTSPRGFRQSSQEHVFQIHCLMSNN